MNSFFEKSYSATKVLTFDNQSPFSKTDDINPYSFDVVPTVTALKLFLPTYKILTGGSDLAEKGKIAKFNAIA